MKFDSRGAWLTRRATDVGRLDPTRQQNAVSQDGSAVEYKVHSLTGHCSLFFWMSLLGWEVVAATYEARGPGDSKQSWGDVLYNLMAYRLIGSIV